MGGGSSKPEIFMTSIELFSEDERLKIKEIFTQICGSNIDGFSETDLLKYGKPYTTDFILRHLFFYMKCVIPDDPGRNTNDFLVNGDEFVVALARILKGTPDDRTLLVKYLCTGESAKSIKAIALKKLIEDLLGSFAKTSCAKSSTLSSWRLAQTRYTDNFSRSLLNDLIYKDDEHMTDEVFPWESAHCTEAVERWMSQTPVLLTLLNDTFHALFPISMVDMMQKTPLVPRVSNVPWTKLTTLLDLPSLLFLNQTLSVDLRGDWRFLFSTRIHGESFSAMTSRILNKGPCLMVVEDTDGHVFGGFVSQSWQLTSQFVGSSQCFLYSISPTMCIYWPTSYNEHYMYLNHGQETIPNGLGMGGQFDYFGLWLDYEFGRGHSKAQPRCTTYNSPQLSKHEQFSIKTLEVWAIGPEPKTNEDEPTHGSILDKDPGAKAMLTLLNKGPVSEGLREEDPTADIPEQHSLPPLS